MSEPLVDPDAADAATIRGTRTEKASALARLYCGWHIAPVQTDEVTLDGDGSDTLLLPTTRLLSVDAIVDETTDDADELDPSTYRVSSKGIVRRRAGCRFPDALGALTVTFTHGYADTPIDVQAAVAALAQRLPSSGAASESAGGVAVTWGSAAGAFTAIERAVLDAYRITDGP